MILQAGDRRFLPVVYEHWLPVVGWDGWYEVSCRGRVRSVDRWVEHVGDSRRRFFRGRVLKQAINSHGYFFVGLSRPGVKRLVVAVHVLVLRAFAGPPKPGEECLHGPRGKLDNRWPEAIRWGTQPENMADRVRDGVTIRGERHGNAKLTEADVIVIREWCTAGERHRVVAASFGISRSAVGSIADRKRWAHVPLR